MIIVEACLYAVSVAVLLAIALATACGGLTSATACAALSAGALMAAWTFWSGRNRTPRWRKLNAWESATVVAFILFSLRTFLWVVFQDDDEIKVLSPNNLGDLSLHITYIREFANGVPFWPENPIYAGAALTYPVGVDLFHSLLTLAGADLYRTFVWIGLAGCLCTALALWRWGGAFAMAGFLFNGGLAGFLFFKTGALADYQDHVAWKSIPLALLTTQRGMLFAIPAGLLLLSSWRARFFETQPAAKDPAVTPAGRGMLPWWGEWLLYASMPVFHVHTFLFLSIMLASWFILRSPARIPILKLVAAAFIPASMLVFLVTDHFHGPSVLGWHPGWMQDEDTFLTACAEMLGTRSPLVTFPVFWIVNFGILPVLIGLLVSKLLSEPRLAWGRAIVLPALGVFLLCCFVKFAPWEWDNTKLMLWSYLAILPTLWKRLIGEWRFGIAVPVCFVLLWSGFVSLVGGIDSSHDGYPVATRSELDGIADAVRTIPPTARFIAHPDYNHPLVLLGRKLALGYTGHVWSHGYDYRKPLAEEEAILNGSPNWHQIAKDLDSRYLFWGTRERDAFPESTQSWRTESRIVASGDWGEIFDLESPPPAPAAVPDFPPE